MPWINKRVLFQASCAGDEEYEVTVVSYSPQTEGTRDEPGDGGEVDFSHTVVRMMSGRKVEEVSFDEFLEHYAAHTGLSCDDAEREVRDRAMIEVIDQLVEDYEDSREGALEDRDV